MKRIAIATMLGIAVTGLSMLFDHQYCMGGQGRGWPVTVIHPAHWHPARDRIPHGDEIFSTLLRTDVDYPPEIDILGLLEDVITWSCVAFFGCLWLARRRARAVNGGPVLSRAWMVALGGFLVGLLVLTLSSFNLGDAWLSGILGRLHYPSSAFSAGWDQIFPFGSDYGAVTFESIMFVAEWLLLGLCIGWLHERMRRHKRTA